jgi:SAM-dependent methyltransferase
MSSIEGYYNQLARYYKYLYPDWEASLPRHAALLDSVIREYLGVNARRLHDAACGIGTQSIGLAQLGYQVTASDISTVEIAQARVEAAQHGVQIEFSQADMRQPVLPAQQPYDVILACDNAVPHLLSEAEILQAFQSFYASTTPQGGCMISVRDYAAMERGGRKLYPRTVHDTPGGRVVLFDLWEFSGDFYDFTTYVVEDQGQPTATTHVIQGGRYYCVTIAALERLFAQAGFQQVITLRERYVQPLIVALKQPKAF